VTTTGAYLLSGHDGPYAEERFTCAGDDDGWWYEATRHHPSTGALTGRLELRVDAGTTRLHVEAGGWVLRGAASGGQALWQRGELERTAAADGFTGTSPGFLVAGARLPPGLRHLVEVTEPVLATRTTSQQWNALGSQEHQGVLVDAWQVDDLATGERRTVRLAGEVVVEAAGVRLTHLARRGLTRP
jgi:hypothetical protein